MLGNRLVDGKYLRRGYTTGSCAAAAAKAAAIALLTGSAPAAVSVSTPKGETLTLPVEDMQLDGQRGKCAVRKYSGDDPDVTDGLLVCAEVRRSPGGIEIDGGPGVGRVTRPGLDQPVGAAAINSGPRGMIAAALSEVCGEQGYAGGLSVTISIPGGEAVARRTFNPRLGIIGGLSVLGTSGIVEPMSSAAIVDTFRAEMRVLRASGGTDILLTPGNYGERFAAEALGLRLDAHVKSSNFIGDALALAAELGFRRILLIAHIGKLVKLGIGVTNTHSGFGDGRMETLIACALRAGAGLEALRALDACVTTDAALDTLGAHGILSGTLDILGARIEETLRRRLPEDVEAGYICFTHSGGRRDVLMQSKNAENLARIWRNDE